MSRIADLITELCPNGVPFRTLGELGMIFGGLTGKSKADFSDGNARFVSYVNAFNNIAVNIHADEFVKIAPGERQRSLQRGDILFTGSSETANEVAMSSVVTEEVHQPLYLNSFTIGYRLNDPEIFDPDFTKHLFRSGAIRKQLIRTASGVTRFNVSKARLAAVRIPVPLPEIQHQIASILDEMDELESALESELGLELESRSLQYAHYRNSLLTLPEGGGVRRAQIGDVLALRAGRFIAASDISPEMDDDHPFPCFGGNGIRGYVAQPNQDGDFVLIGRQGALSGNVKRVTGKFYATEHAVVVTPIEDFDTAWLFHVLTNMNLNQYVSQGAQPGLAVSNLNKIVIPVPHVADQKTRGEILDKFDALVNKLGVGLLAELHARRTQYQHYRDRLLSFEEAAV